MTAQLLKATMSADPIEAIEQAAIALGLEAERTDERELQVAAPGLWRDFGLWFTWRPDIATLQMGAPLDLKVPPGRLLEACRLVALVNERLWVGHFDLWSDESEIVYRSSAVLSESGAIEKSQIERLIRGAAEAIDKFLPAFNYLLWGGKPPAEALEASLFETAGNA
jgi:hypothetical protein